MDIYLHTNTRVPICWNDSFLNVFKIKIIYYVAGKTITQQNKAVCLIIY